jgi:glycosyltransferase involved in cell wall biosynthesis
VTDKIQYDKMRGASPGNGRTVVHVTTVHPRYDTRIFKKELAAVAKAGFRAELIVADSIGSERKEGIDVIDVGGTRGRLARMLVLPFRAFRVIRRRRPALVHFHDPELLPIALMLQALGYHVIYDAHEDVPRSLMSRRWIPAGVRGIVSKVAELVEHFVARRLTAVVAATPVIGSRFQNIGADAVTIRNYPVFSKTAFELARNPLPRTFCYIGAISKHRGIIEMISAVERIDCKLILAGRFGDSEFQRYVSGLTGWKNVQYLGNVDYEEIWSIMGRSLAGFLLLHPVQNYVDALPVKMFEYMAAGLPVVCSNFHGWPDIVRANRAGLVCNPFNIDEITAAMEAIIRSPGAATEMGQRGRATVASEYLWENEANRLISLYERILSRAA